MKTKESKITFTPFGGLGNRMWAISAAIDVAHKSNSKLTIMWSRDRGLNCKFEDLFLPFDDETIVLKECSFVDSFLYEQPHKANLFLSAVYHKLAFDKVMYHSEIVRRMHQGFDFSKWVQGKKVFMSSCFHFNRSILDGDFDMFIPQPEIQREIDSTLCNIGEGEFVGVHVRRTDNAQAIKNSPLRLYIDRMAEEPSNTKFYVASDSDEVKKILCQRFPDRVYFQDRTARRDDVQGMKDAVKEMFILSRTRLLLGSTNSSFVITASKIGRVPLIDLRV